MKKLWKALLFFAGMLGMLSAASAQGAHLNLNLPSKQGFTAMTVTHFEESPADPLFRNPFCMAFTAIRYTTASHPGGNRHGALNEDNGGLGVRCFPEQEKSWWQWYLVTAALTNSQYGDTLGFGPGIKVRIFEVWRVGIDVGGEIPWVWYSFRPGSPRKPLVVPLPLTHVGLTMRLGKTTELSMLQMWLPKGAARLRATLFDQPEAYALSHDPSSKLYDPTWASTDIGKRRMGVSLLFSYQF